ncbi:MAG: AAA family ATPase [Planctomycetaceae bacterium]|nr:AAA family ATPase [Planctomycetaceae bacterium]
MPKISEAIRNFLDATKGNNSDLVGRWSISMETQINVAADNGEPVDGKRSTYSDGEYEWFNVRIPKNAATTPEFRDWELRWPLSLHAEAIGMTGWDWEARKSRWVGFDVDSLVSHAKGIGISDEELERVKNAAKALPYVEVRRSTGGAGVHLYVYLDGIPTANHTEHAALARCILGMMSLETGFDFASQIDCCGGNMWVWHRKMTESNEGLKLLKPAEKVLTLADLPSNWRDHIEVVTHRRSKVRVHAELKDEYLDPFEELASARRIIPLDETHKQIIDELSHSGFSTIWVSDHHLLQTHTCALGQLMESGKYQGIFRTISKGNNKGTPNCFMFPLSHGGWRVFRFSPGVNEDETWSQDKEGWTNCYFNCKPNLATAAKAMGGQEDPDKGGFMFNSVAEAKEVAKVLGQHIELSGPLPERQSHLKAHRDGRLVMSICKRNAEQDETLRGWISKPDAWVKLFNVFADPEHENASKQVRKRRFKIRRISCKELDSGCNTTEYLIDRMLVARQPCIVGGGMKCLKTTVLIDLAISLASGEPFLQQFHVNRSCNVGIISGESGIDAIRDTARCVCKFKNIQLADITTLTLSTDIPRVDNPDHLDALDSFIKETRAEVVAIDPTYLAMPGSDAGNLMAQGERLARVNEVCERNNTGIILVHHNTRTSGRQNRYKPPELDSLAWSGYAEWARQWILLGRREAFAQNTREHRLWLSAGGSAGHSSLWALDADEGPSDQPRYWKVAVLTPDEACEEKEAKKEEKKAAPLRERILEAAASFPGGESKSCILIKAGITHTAKVSAFFDSMVEEADSKLVQCRVKKKRGSVFGYRLAQAV